MGYTSPSHSIEVLDLSVAGLVAVLDETEVFNCLVLRISGGLGRNFDFPCPEETLLNGRCAR